MGLVAWAALALASAWLYACGGAETGLTEVADGSTMEASTDGALGDADGGDGDSGSPGDGDAGARGDVTDAASEASPEALCGTKATEFECLTCCATIHQTGGRIALLAQVQCACQDPQHCQNECSNTLCALKTPEAGSPCALCVRASLQPDAGAKSCVQAVGTVCNPNADCVAFEGCIQTRCAGKN